MLLAAFIAAFLAAFFLAPLGLVIGRGFVYQDRVSFEWFQRIFTNEILREEFVNTLLLACAATGLSVLLGVPLALLRGRTRFRGQSLLGVLVLIPLILPPFVGALAIRQIFSQYGVLNMYLAHLGILDFRAAAPPDWLLEGGFWGVAILQTLHLFPIMYLNTSAALANIDPAYTQAARNLGAGPLRTFFRITLPLLRPGLFAGGTIVFIWAFTDIGTPLMLQYNRLIPVTIFNELKTIDYSGKVFALVFVLLSASVGLYVMGKFVFGRSIGAESSKASTAAETRPLGILGTLLAWVGFGSVVLIAILPHIGVVLIAVADEWTGTILPEAYTWRHLAAVFQDQATYRSILNSIKYAGVATAVDVVLGCVAAWLIVRSRIWGRGVLDSLAMLPLAVPGLILAAGYIILTVRGSLLESIGPLGNPFGILVIAYSVRRLPFMLRGVAAGLQQVPESLEEAARNLGSRPAGAALRITVPLIAANIIAAGVLTFSFAMLEVSDSLILAQRQVHFPITKMIYELFNAGTPQAVHMAAALGVYGMFLLGGTMALATLLLGRRLGAIFRA